MERGYNKEEDDCTLCLHHYKSLSFAAVWICLLFLIFCLLRLNIYQEAWFSCSFLFLSMGLSYKSNIISEVSDVLSLF